MPQAAVKMQGELETFTCTGDSGKPIVRRFCPVCGSSITGEPSNPPELMLISGGTLDKLPTCRIAQIGRCGPIRYNQRTDGRDGRAPLALSAGGKPLTFDFTEVIPLPSLSLRLGFCDAGSDRNVHNAWAYSSRAASCIRKLRNKIPRQLQFSIPI
jgi:hypothetical protein